jgi:hypothetical protein
MRPAVQRRLLWALPLALAVVCFVALAAWMFGGAFIKERERSIAASAAAHAGAPACPTLTAGEFEAAHHRRLQGVQYLNGTFVRQHGPVECVTAADRKGPLKTYAVCAFTSPSVLKVTTAKGDWYFAPGVGQPATVSTAGDVARCVLASDFTIATLEGRAAR